MIWRRILASALAVVLLPGYGALPAVAATVRLLAPKGDSTVSGSVEVSVGYESGASEPVTSVALHVDGALYASKAVEAGQGRGVVSFLWDSTRFADGSHGLSVFLYSRGKIAGKSYTKVRVWNAAPATGLPSPAPPRGSGPIRFLNLRDAETVRGVKVINIACDRSLGESPFIAIYVDRTLKYISNRQPFSYELDTEKLAEGTHLVEAEARNSNQEVLARSAVRINVEHASGLAREVAALASAPQQEPDSRVTMPAPVPVPVPAPERTAASGPATAARAPETAAPRPDRPLPAPVMRETAPQSAAAPLPAPAPPGEPLASPDARVPARGPELTPARIAALPAKNPAARAPALPAEPVAPVSSAPGTSTGREPAAPRWTAGQPEPVIFAQGPGKPASPSPVRPAGNLARPEPQSEPVSTPPADPQAVNAPAITPARDPAQPVMTARVDVPPRLPVPAAPPDEDASRPAAPAEPEASLREVRPAEPGPFLGVPARPTAAEGEEPVLPAALLPTEQETAQSLPEGERVEPSFLTMAAAPAWKETLPEMRPTLPAPQTRRVSTRTVTEQRPLIQEGASLVHLRHVVERLGGRVSYDHATKTATAVLDGRELTADLKTGAIRIGGQIYPGEAILVSDRAILPAGALARAFGLTVRWDSRSRCVAFSRSVILEDRSAQG